MGEGICVGIRKQIPKNQPLHSYVDNELINLLEHLEWCCDIDVIRKKLSINRENYYVDDFRSLHTLANVSKRVYS
jgi:hypothetical protein